MVEPRQKAESKFAGIFKKATNIEPDEQEGRVEASPP